ncbi:homeodomain-interacting protein kinase 1-like isoform X2 [Sebastes umbrosus]|uniref:homeodomain-interacting protein kinase 1-like isoform X2 n=1 Tax=Sebastes umbrosus TaxID=72105 RepID=UPI0018A01495|nr:homeodomain-interacting protein kinase 1-like isoform X2 [Sebastes umbrosus]
MATELTSISDNYDILDVLGEGSYGIVVGCYKRDTKEVVAVKLLKKPRFSQNYDRREMVILKKLQCLDPDESRIIRCLEWYHGKETAYMVFEMMDISLHGFMAHRKWAPLPLNGIRTIIKDLATALAALGRVGLIHTDLKLANVMLVDHKTQPFRTKLIDFGLTLRKSEAWPGQAVQPLLHRSPEVILGLPFSEAIDIWALGTIMARLSLGFSLFPGTHEYDVLRYIIDLLGEVPKKLVKAGRRTKLYYKGRGNFFMNTNWTMKTPEQFFKETGHSTQEHRAYKAPSLNELTALNMLRGNKEEEADRRACFDLMKKMLQMDPKNRITPNKILAHPFIKGSYVRYSKGCTMSTVVDVSKSPAETKVDDCPQAVEKKSHPPKDEKSNSPKDEKSNSPKAKDEKSNSPKDEKSNSPKDEKSNSPKDEKSNSPKDEKSNSPKDEKSNSPKDEKSNSPKDEKSNSPKDEKSNSPKDEKYNSPKDEESNSPKDEDARDSKSVSDSTDSSLSSSEDSTFEDLDSMIIPSAPQNRPESSQIPEAIEPKKKKKKKRGIQRFLSTLKRNIFCCFCAPKNGDE